MNLLKINLLVIISILLSSGTVMAQDVMLTLNVKNIKEMKGNILIAVKGRENSEKSLLEMFPVTSDTMECTVKNIPWNVVDVSVFHDVNGNYKLDMDEQHIPVEPCFKKEKMKIKIKNGEQRLTVRLKNIKELLGL